MPVLPILDADGQLLETAPCVVQAVMWYPRDAARRERFLDAYLKRLLVEAIEEAGRWPIELTASAFALVARAPGLDELLRREAKAIRQRGFVAGHWLHHMLAARLHHPAYATNLKWQYFMAAYVLNHHNAQNPDERWAVSDQSLVTFRNEFLPVAHLWAALRVFEEMDEREALVDSARLPRFLACAEALRGAATKLRLFDELKCGFCPEDAWVPPPGLALPAGAMWITPLQGEALEALARYVSPPTLAERRARAKKK